MSIVPAHPCKDACSQWVSIVGTCVGNLNMTVTASINSSDLSSWNFDGDLSGIPNCLCSGEAIQASQSCLDCGSRSLCIQPALTMQDYSQVCQSPSNAWGIFSRYHSSIASCIENGGTATEQPTETPSESSSSEQPSETPSESSSSEQPSESSSSEQPSETPSESSSSSEQPSETPSESSSSSEQPSETPSESSSSSEEPVETPSESSSSSEEPCTVTVTASASASESPLSASRPWRSGGYHRRL